METLPVTLIVKAPNQQIEDQTIKCESSWTIHKLKQHLSEVYPSKPAKHEQKLIYSGQLLTDSLVLKDILRQYEGQNTHTVHLVCTPTAQEQPKPAAPQPPVEESSPIVGGTIPNGQFVPGMDPNQFSVQMAMMQQAYIQYMTQYMQFAAQSYATATPPQAQPAQPHEEPEAAAQAAALEQREQAERDWLDVFYMVSRALVLFSVVYFYSSPVRFAFVLLLVVSMYLYQIGFFRTLNQVNHNNNNNNVAPPGEGVEPREEDTSPSRLTIVWTFFTTFFASLIPEIPNAV